MFLLRFLALVKKKKKVFITAREIWSNLTSVSEKNVYVLFCVCKYLVLTIFIYSCLRAALIALENLMFSISNEP